MKFLFFSQWMPMRGKVHVQVVSVRRVERCSWGDEEKPPLVLVSHLQPVPADTSALEETHPGPADTSALEAGDSSCPCRQACPGEAGDSSWPAEAPPAG